MFIEDTIHLDRNCLNINDIGRDRRLILSISNVLVWVVISCKLWNNNQIDLKNDYSTRSEK
jgi:hypothetical protein